MQVPQVQGEVHRPGPGLQGSGGGEPEGQGRHAADSGRRWFSQLNFDPLIYPMLQNLVSLSKFGSWDYPPGFVLH